MSTTLIIPASILAVFAMVLIPFMMVKSDRQRRQVRQHAQAKKLHKKKKKR
jgi:preprotein translocase subunit YajC